MLIYQNLTQHIQDYFKTLKRTNSFYQRIFNGTLTAAELACFLQNVSFLTAHTPEHLTLAATTARAQGHEPLAHYFEEKFREEVGHDQWGIEDVAALRKRFPITQDQIGIVSEMQVLVASNEAMILRDPFQYFIYILYAEYFTVLAGPTCVRAIENNSKIPPGMMTIISKHAELDQHHIAEWAKDAEEVGLNSAHCAAYRKVLDGIMDRYSLFCEALTRPHEKAA
ncbi:MAG TPA: hypothetical protein VFO10_07960 [Oligoflexus sp.]|uniref:hypothetical protein n=1 Tax=Oligoflexus sp. TaxID=1971216 RepID=UPI002D801033|nr:hypothetical protein [Oligoflexus sp.]HET9237170.1 hypothetical protein [Oligoflexus sp.]